MTSATKLDAAKEAENPHTRKSDETGFQQRSRRTSKRGTKSSERIKTFQRKVAEIQNGVENKYQRSHRNSNKEMKTMREAARPEQR